MWTRLRIGELERLERSYLYYAGHRAAGVGGASLCGSIHLPVRRSCTTITSPCTLRAAMNALRRGCDDDDGERWWWWWRECPISFGCVLVLFDRYGGVCVCVFFFFESSTKQHPTSTSPRPPAHHPTFSMPKSPKHVKSPPRARPASYSVDEHGNRRSPQGRKSARRRDMTRVFNGEQVETLTHHRKDELMMGSRGVVVYKTQHRNGMAARRNLRPAAPF